MPPAPSGSRDLGSLWVLLSQISTSKIVLKVKLKIQKILEDSDIRKQDFTVQAVVLFGTIWRCKKFWFRLSASLMIFLAFGLAFATESKKRSPRNVHQDSLILQQDASYFRIFHQFLTNLQLCSSATNCATKASRPGKWCATRRPTGEWRSWTTRSAQMRSRQRNSPACCILARVWTGWWLTGLG